MSTALPPTTKKQPNRLFLVAITAICGAEVMVLEVLGSRVLGTFFGVSLFVWTSLIAVTLVSLALGYAAGGVLVDRRSDLNLLLLILLAAGFLILIIPYAKSPVLKYSMTFGLRAGSLAASALLFGPPILLLGIVFPFVVGIASRETEGLGRTVGFYNAASTLGSFLGTLLTGFVFLAYLRTDRILQVAGASLVVLAVACFLVSRRKPWAALALLPVLFLQPPTGTLQKKMGDMTPVALLFSKDTFYGSVRVQEYHPEHMRVRELMIDGLVQGGIDMINGLSIYEYPYLMEFIPYGTKPDGKECLVLGLGAGLIPMWYEAEGIRADVVDVNPTILSVAREYFGFRVSGNVAIADARYFLSTTQKTYDYVIVDVANGDWPTHILTLECFRSIRDKLADGGVVAINVIGSLRRYPLMSASIVRTLKEVFRNVKVYATADPSKGGDIQNLVIVAYDDPQLSFDSRRIRKFPAHNIVKTHGKMLVTEYVYPEGTPSILLTDEYNPADYFDNEIREIIRKSVLSHVDWDILI